MSELRKLVNDGFNKFKIYEEGKKALDELDSLKQAQSDFTKSVNDLMKKKEKLEKETSALAEKISNADEQAAFKVKTAEEKAKSIMDAVNKSVEAEQAASKNKLNELAKEIARQESLADESRLKASEAQIKLDKINKELDAAKVRLRGMID